MSNRCEMPVASGADAASVPWDEINANDWRPWSMQKPANAPGMWCQRGWFHGSGASNAKIECIVCYSEPDSHTEADLEHWTSCRRCSALWCNGCMEAMYNRARDDADEEVELTCPQCRKPVPEMQDEARLERLVAKVRERPPYAPPVGVLSPSRVREFCARVIMDYENLVSELVHLCKATPGGLPYFTMPTEAVARIMSRDDGLVGLVKGLQGAQADSKLRRALRAGDYAGAAAVVVRGYGFWLQNLEKEASGAVVLQQLHDNLSCWWGIPLGHPDGRVNPNGFDGRHAKDLTNLLARLVAKCREKEKEEAAPKPAAAAPRAKRRKRS